MKQGEPLVFDARDGGGGELDHGLPTEEIHQHGDALTLRHHTSDHRLQTMKGAASQLDGFTRAQFMLEHADLFCAKRRSQILDNLVRDPGVMSAEAHHFADARGGFDFVEAFWQFESGEDVIGKQGFREPDQAAGLEPAETDARSIGLDPELTPKPTSGNVLVPGVGAKTKPGGCG